MSLCLVLKLNAVALQQKAINEFLGSSSYVQQLVGVRAVNTRAIEKISLWRARLADLNAHWYPPLLLVPDVIGDFASPLLAIASSACGSEPVRTHPEQLLRHLVLMVGVTLGAAMLLALVFIAQEKKPRRIGPEATGAWTLAGKGRECGTQDRRIQASHQMEFTVHCSEVPSHRSSVDGTRGLRSGRLLWLLLSQALQDGGTCQFESMLSCAHVLLSSLHSMRVVSVVAHECFQVFKIARLCVWQTKAYACAWSLWVLQQLAGAQRPSDRSQTICCQFRDSPAGSDATDLQPETDIAFRLGTPA